MGEEELKCSVCHELPPGEVHQCTRGHFLCVSCWNRMDDAVGGRKCPECRVPLGRSNRCRVAELAIKNLPRPDGYTTPPPVRPNNRGQPLTPLLEGPPTVTPAIQQTIQDLERCLVDEIAASNAARAAYQLEQSIRMQLEQEKAELEQEKAELERKNTQLEQKLKETNWTSSRSDAAMRIAVVATQERDAMATRLAALEIENSARSPLRWIEES